MTKAIADAAIRVAEHSQRWGSRPGSDIISLASGDPDFQTPGFITDALVNAVEAGFTHYVDGQGDIELRTALADQMARRAGARYSAKHILVTHGANSGLAATMIATVNPGDRVLIPEPTYSLYADLVRMVGGTPDFVPLKDDFRLDLDELNKRAPGARMIVICHPSNPTGRVYRRSELNAVAQIATAHDLLVLADEAYDHIVFDGVEFVSTLEIPELRDRLIYCQTMSKTYAMTGWRLGYSALPETIAPAVAQIHRTLNGPSNAAVQRAALAAITTPSDVTEQMRQEYGARRELVLDALTSISTVNVVPPEGTFYAFVGYSHAIQSRDLAQLSLSHGVAVRPGSEFGPSGEGHIRIAFSSSRDDLQQGLSRLRAAFNSLD